ncbi:hypothetical protein GCM10025734_30720 [Kitasatospora paranensis]
MTTSPMTTSKPTVVLVGYGMVGHRFLEALADTGAADRYRVVVLAEEPRHAYDRVALTSYFSGKSADDLLLAEAGFTDRHGFEVHLSSPVASIDRAAKSVTTAAGHTIGYDTLVLATGSYPFVPPVEGKDAEGCFVYRTIEDLEAIEAYAATANVGAVVGGGLLGLEAAGALRGLGLETHVVEFAPRLMPVQVDDGGGEALRRTIEEMGVVVHTGVGTKTVVVTDGRATGMTFTDGSDLETDLVIFSAGVRPRDQLARDCGLTVGERGGIAIDELCRTSDEHVFAIGECALAVDGRVYGLVAPGYEMAQSVARQLADETGKPFTGADLSTKLKLLGVDVASFGDAFGTTPVRWTSSTPTPAPVCTRSSSSPPRARCWAASWSATPRRTPRCGRWPAPATRCRCPPSRWCCRPAWARRSPWAAPRCRTTRWSATATTSPRARSAPPSPSTPAARCPRSRSAPRPAPAAAPASSCSPPSSATSWRPPASRSTRACAPASRTPAPSCTRSSG